MSLAAQILPAHLCSYCGKRFSCNQLLTQHAQDVHFRCKPCSRFFVSMEALEHHDRTAHANKCSQCSRTFSSRQALNSHTKAKHSGSRARSRPQASRPVRAVQEGNQGTFTLALGGSSALPQLPLPQAQTNQPVPSVSTAPPSVAQPGNVQLTPDRAIETHPPAEQPSAHPLAPQPSSERPFSRAFGTLSQQQIAPYHIKQEPDLTHPFGRVESQEELDVIVQKLSGLWTENQKSKGANQKLQADHEYLEYEISRLRDRVQGLEEYNQRLNNDNVELELKNKELEDLHRAAEAKCASLTTMYQTAVGKELEMVNIMQELNTSCQGLEDEMEAMREDADVLSASMAHLVAQDIEGLVEIFMAEIEAGLDQFFSAGFSGHEASKETDLLGDGVSIGQTVCPGPTLEAEGSSGEGEANDRNQATDIGASIDGEPLDDAMAVGFEEGELFF